MAATTDLRESVETRTFVHPGRGRYVEISRAENEVEVTTGRVHSAGRATVRTFATLHEAQEHVAKRVAHCLAEGYREHVGFDVTQPAPPTRVEGKLLAHVKRPAFWREWLRYHLLHRLPAQRHHLLDGWFGADGRCYWDTLFPDHDEMATPRVTLRVPMPASWLLCVAVEMTDSVNVSYLVTAPGLPDFELGSVEGAHGDSTLPFLRYEEAEAIVAAAPSQADCSEAALRLLLLPGACAPESQAAREAASRRIAEHLIAFAVVSEPQAHDAARALVGEQSDVDVRRRTDALERFVRALTA